MKRPEQKSKLPNKPKSLDKRFTQVHRENIVEKVRYGISEYHCYGPQGQRPATRTKPAMHCPRHWTRQQGLNAVKAAIRAGRVSKAKLGVFPRHIWHQEGDVWYEARTVNSAPGEYHGYPIEVSGLPAGLV